MQIPRTPAPEAAPAARPGSEPPPDPAAARLARGLLGGDPAGDDLAQEAWLVARRRGVSTGGFRAGVVRRLAARWRRGEERRRARERIAATRAVTRTLEPNAALERGELAAILATALDELDADQREAVRLRFVDDLSVKDIAARTGAREDTVRRRIRRGLERLRATLERRHGGWYRLALAALAGVALPRPERDGAPLALAAATTGAATTGAAAKTAVGIGAVLVLLVGFATYALLEPRPAGAESLPAAALPAAVATRTSLAPLAAGGDARGEPTAAADAAAAAVPVGRAPAGPALALLPGILPARVTGAVYGDKGPIEHALVVARIALPSPPTADGEVAGPVSTSAATWVEVASTTTDARGEFDLGRPVGGDVPLRVSVAALGHATLSQPVPLALDGEFAAPLVFHLDRGRELAGALSDDAGRPLGAVAVMASAEPLPADEPSVADWAARYHDDLRADLRAGGVAQVTLTDGDGRFRLRGLGERAWFAVSLDPRWRVVDSGPHAAGATGVVLAAARRRALFVTERDPEPIGRVVTTLDPIRVEYEDGTRANFRLDEFVSGSREPVLRSDGTFIDLALGDDAFEAAAEAGTLASIHLRGSASVAGSKPRRWTARFRPGSIVDGSPLLETDWRAGTRAERVGEEVALLVVDEWGAPLGGDVRLEVAIGDDDGRPIRCKVDEGWIEVPLPVGPGWLALTANSAPTAWPTSRRELVIRAIDADPGPVVVSRPARLVVAAPAQAVGDWWIELLKPDGRSAPRSIARHPVAARSLEVPYLPHGDWIVRLGRGDEVLDERAVRLPPGATTTVGGGR